MSSDHGKRYAIGSGRTETMPYVLGVIFELEFARGLPPCCVRPESEKMNLVWLVALILSSGFAIAGGQKLKWKLFNLVITLGCMGLGFGIGYAAGLGSENMGRAPDVALPVAMIFGILGALGCVQLNNRHVK